MQRTHFKRVALLLYYFSSYNISRHFRQHDSYSSDIGRYLNISTWWWIDIYYIDKNRSWNFPHPIKVQRTSNNTLTWNEYDLMTMYWTLIHDCAYSLCIFFQFIEFECITKKDEFCHFSIHWNSTKVVAMQMVLFCAGGSPSSINLNAFDQLNSKQGCAHLTIYHDLNACNLNAVFSFDLNNCIRIGSELLYLSAFIATQSTRCDINPWHEMNFVWKTFLWRTTTRCAIWNGLNCVCGFWRQKKAVIWTASQQLLRSTCFQLT